MAEASELQPNVSDLADIAGIGVEDLDQECRECDLSGFAYHCDPWELIGHHLQLKDVDISAIKENYDSAEMRRLKVLKKWWDTNLRPTYKVLIEAFLRCGKTQQALQICKTVKRLYSEGSNTCQVGSREHVSVATEQMSYRSVGTTADNTVQTSVRESIRDLELKFSDVQRQFVTAAGVTLERLKDCVATLPSFKSSTPSRLFRSDSVHDFFHYLKEYCNTQSHDILDDLIKVLGDNETKKKMHHFKMEYQAFQRRAKLKDFVGNYEGPTTTPSNYKELEMKLGENWQERTLEDLDNLRRQISLEAWLLKKVEEGCFIVQYLIPSHENLIFDKIDDYLHSQNVVCILIDNEPVFKSGGGMHPLQCPTTSDSKPILKLPSKDVSKVEKEQHQPRPIEQPVDTRNSTQSLKQQALAMEEEERAELQLSITLKKWKEKSDKRPLTIVTLGKPGSGKSALINNLLQLPERSSGFSVESVTTRVRKHSSTKEGIDIHIIDTPGFDSVVIHRSADEEQGIIAELSQVTGGRADFVLYCASALPGHGNKIDEIDIKMIRALSSGFGNQIWKRVVFVITFANAMATQYSGDKMKLYISEYVKEFNEALKKAGIKDITAKSIMEMDTQSAEASFDGITAVLAGNKPPDQLPHTDNWIASLSIEILKKCDPNAVPYLLQLQGLLSPVLKVLAGGRTGAGAGAGAGAVVGAVVLPGIGAIPVGAIGGMLGATGAGAASLGNYFRQIVNIAKLNGKVDEIIEQKKVHKEY